MTDNTLYLIFIIVAALLASIVLLFIAAQVIKFVFLRKLTGNSESFYGSLKQAQEAIENAKRRLADEMVPYDRYKNLLKAETEALDRMNALKEESAQLAKERQTLSAEVVEKERKKEELTKSSTNTLLLVGELIATRTTLEDEMAVLQGNLDTSKSELQTLVGEIEMAEEQKAAFQEVSDTLEEVKERLFEVASTYKDSAKNLLELENQYQSLEKEYKKLIELNIKKEAVAAVEI